MDGARIVRAVVSTDCADAAAAEKKDCQPC
jgi:hypothetical protein